MPLLRTFARASVPLSDDAHQIRLSEVGVNGISDRVKSLRNELDALRPAGGSLLSPDQQRSQDIELTYSSNAIEGNTLTLEETAALIEHGAVPEEKHLHQIFEATDHFEAIQWARTMASSRVPLGEETATELHRRIVLNSRRDIAGMYSQNARRIHGSHAVFPNPVKIPSLMERLGRQLADDDGSPRAAFDIHHQLVTIHPFDDGNGRTARLLMNLLLLRSGYVPVSVRLTDRQEYLNAIKAAQLDQDPSASAFQSFMHNKLAVALEHNVRRLIMDHEAHQL